MPTKDENKTTTAVKLAQIIKDVYNLNDGGISAFEKINNYISHAFYIYSRINMLSGQSRDLLLKAIHKILVSYIDYILLNSREFNHLFNVEFKIPAFDPLDDWLAPVDEYVFYAHEYKQVLYYLWYTLSKALNDLVNFFNEQQLPDFPITSTTLFDGYLDSFSNRTKNYFDALKISMKTLFNNEIVRRII